MKIVFLYFILSLFSLFSSAQTTDLSKDSSSKYFDSLVSKYEAEGLSFYKKGIYGTAVLRYEKAYSLIDSLYKSRNKFSDEIDLYVTDCNIAVCYDKRKLFPKAFKHLDEDALWKQPSPKEQFRQICLLAYLQFVMADTYVQMRQKEKAMEYYGVGIGNLEQIHYSPKGTLHYKFGIKEYSFSSVCRTMGDMHSATGDTVLANKYYHKIPKVK
jgi:tetratricopeptide (TPR) repeat protein